MPSGFHSCSRKIKINNLTTANLFIRIGVYNFVRTNKALPV
jgi:hypothetical protein